MALVYAINNYSVGVLKNWSISSKINSRSTLSITVSNLKLLPSLDVGDDFLILKDNVAIFSGIIQGIEKYEDIPGYLYYALQVVDNSAIADKRIIADVAINQSIETIVNDLIFPILEDEGVTIGRVECDFLVKKAVFNYIKVSEALNILSSLSGYLWYISNDKKLYFIERNTYIAPFQIFDGNQHYDFSQKSDMKTYRNKQYIRGGKCRTDAQTLEKPTPQPDGISRNFITRYGIAEKPRIFIDDVEVGSNYIGVNGVDENKKWYFGYDSNVLSQANTEIVLSSSNKLEVSYVGLRNLFLVVEDSEQIVERATIEAGTTGIYESLIKETSLDDKNQAIDYGTGILRKYGEISDIVTFKTEMEGLEAGQLLNIYKPLYNIYSNFLIESIEISLIGVDTLMYNVVALDGASLGGWEEFFKNIIKGGKEFLISENEILIKLQTFTETMGLSSEINVGRYTCLFPSDTLYPATDLYPGTLIGTISLSD